MHYLSSLAAPVLLPAAAVLRPRFGQFPLVLLLLCLLWIGLLRWALPGFGRRATLLALCATALMVGSWLPRIAAHSWGGALLTPTFYRYVILPATAVQVLMLLTLCTAPLWLLPGWLFRRIPKKQPPEQGSERGPTRRTVLAALSWAPPATAALVAAYGVGIESRHLIVRRLQLKIPGLPDALRGLRIGQITDTHIALDLTPIEKLARGCELLSGEGLDLLCVTGDVCDNPRQLRDCLHLLSQVPARLGRFGCLGNHELYLGLPLVRRSYDHSEIHLLEDQCVTLTHGGSPLTLAAVGYPHGGRGPTIAHERVPGMLRAALAQRPSASPLTLMLSHHPHVFKQAAGHRIDLMLSGHTHGGQIGLGEHSLLEPAYGLVRGLFRVPDPARTDGRPETQLFVSSGAGHWLPWRVNCPPEVVVIELV